jgi:orotate phosphoribosyltransferase
MNDDRRARLRQILLEKSVCFGEFTLASGAKSDFYVDARVTTTHAGGANLIGELGWETVKDACEEHGVEPLAIGGMTMGADPISLAVAMKSAQLDPEKAIPAYVVRKEAKEHGRGRRIEGNFPEDGGQVVVVDDVITTGGSTLKAIDAIEEAGGKVVFALVLVDREEGGRAAIEARGVPVYTLFTKSELKEAGV